jgi:S-formylglutathione hydrolase FrmB
MAFPGMPKTEPTPFKTLYLLHGYMGNNIDWLINTQINEMSQQFNIAVVMPSGENGFYVDQLLSGYMGSEFISRELVEYTRSIFPLSHKREETFIGGLSMGGYGALYNGLKNSDVFGATIALSSAIITETIQGVTDEPNFMGITRGYYKALLGDNCFDIDLNASEYNPAVLAKKILDSGKPLPKLYFACGYNDMLCLGSRKLHEDLNNMGFEHCYEEGPGSHEWAFWNRHLQRGLARLIKLPEIPAGFANPFQVNMREDKYIPDDLK